ncbi:ribosomal-processing cysteine protease Prp [Acetohalobium arabaticum]|uniref:Ribosomal processing cysteine protease Prp n=1 Tax=Acetohalobium arabaticum (strain ATCC 49924 / DSM 5501 / Z-7288) TaxID=574087 RepID=D9QV53_ACEAZ|nr:ribosomal-processing cysteine protease Prp [Acetohalobium arabaticum]ADL12112.1 protein of unknown function DUF464 [Acetohalobium arabaticum DSM 5501]
MVKVIIERNQSGQVTEFRAEGHAEYGEYGSDIVCAAVSAILQTAVFGLTEHLGLSVEVDTSGGWLQCNLEDINATKEINAVLETMVIGLEKTAQSYPDNLKILEGGKKDD